MFVLKFILKLILNLLFKKLKGQNMEKRKLEDEDELSRGEVPDAKKQKRVRKNRKK